MSNPLSYRDRIYACYATEKIRVWKEFTESDYSRWARAYRAYLMGWLPNDKSAVCLDLGCGPGNILFFLRGEGFQNIRGVDISHEQVELSMRICPDVEKADVREYLQRFPATFDLIIALDIIEHFRKDELLDLLQDILNALKPGGTLIIQTPNAESPWGLMHRYHDFTHEIAFDPQSLAHVLKIVGFSSFEARMCGPYIHGCKGFLRALVWKAIWAALAVWNLAETGSLGSGIYTRVFVAKAKRPISDKV